MKARPIGLVALLGCLSSIASAEPKRYRVVPTPEGRGVEIRLPYSLGTHTQTARDIRGELQVDVDTLSKIDGSLRTAIVAIQGDGGTRDCHMREALGLSYGPSKYPEEHVCEDDRLPKSGADAVSYPDILLKLNGLHPLDPPTQLAQGGPVRVEASGSWTIHGVSRPVKLLLRLSKEGDGFRVTGESQLRLADFGVVVKSAKVVFVTISVGDTAKLRLDLSFTPVRS